MFPADVEEECLWSSLEDLVWASVRYGEWLTMIIRTDEYLGRRGEVFWDVGFSVEAVGCSYWGKFSYDLLKATEVFWGIGCREEFSKDDQRIAVNHFNR